MSSFKYNPEEEDQPFKSFRLTISNEILVESIEDIQRKTGKSERDIAKDALIMYLQEQGQIELH